MSVGCSIWIGECMADQHTDGSRFSVVPVGGSQFVSRGVPPAYVFVFPIDLTRTFQECVASQARRLPAQREKLSDERSEPGALRRQAPIDPTDFVVLTVSIVVAALGA